MSNLSELLPSGGGQNVVEFTADGSISSGEAVALQTDGTVKAVGISSGGAGTASVFDSDNLSRQQIAYDANANKIVIAYTDSGNSSYGTAVVGTISGSTISFGTPAVFKSDNTFDPAIEYNSSRQTMAIAFRDTNNSNRGKLVEGTVSGTSISFGTVFTFEYGSCRDFSIADTADGSNNVVITYHDASNSNYTTAIVATMQGNITFSTAVVVESTSSNNDTACVYDTSQSKVVSVYRLTSNGYNKAAIGTISGSSAPYSISFGTPVTYASTNAAATDAVYDSNAQKVVFSYQDFGDSTYGKAVVGTVSGTSISFGSTATFNAATTYYPSITYDSTNQKILIAYSANSVTGEVVEGTVSGTSITFGSSTTFYSNTANWNDSVFDSSSSQAIIIYSDGNATNAGTAVTFQGSSSNVADFIGLASAAISDTASGDINVKGGINEAQTGLTIGSDYYVQNDGSLAATNIPYDISSASYDSVSFSVASEETIPRSITFNTDGTKMFVVGVAGQDIGQYTLSTAFDISTASFVNSFSLSSQDTQPESAAFNTDGTKMFIVGVAGDAVYEYNLSTAFDVSSSTYSQSFSVSSQDTTPNGLAFNTDGTKMFVVGQSGQDINEYTLTSGFDVSTASFVDSFSVSSQETQPHEVTFNADGTKMYVLGRISDAINQYNLSTGFDVSTASYSTNFSVASQETDPTGMAFNASGTKIYVIGYNTDSVFQYSTSPASTTVKVGQAISATTINMMDLT